MFSPKRARTGGLGGGGGPSSIAHPQQQQQQDDATSPGGSGQDTMAPAAYRARAIPFLLSRLVAGRGAASAASMQLRPALQRVLEDLTDMLDATADLGRSSALLLVGAPGSGKTLVRAAAPGGAGGRGARAGRRIAPHACTSARRARVGWLAGWLAGWHAGRQGAHPAAPPPRAAGAGARHRRRDGAQHRPQQPQRGRGAPQRRPARR